MQNYASINFQKIKKYKKDYADKNSQSCNLKRKERRLTDINFKIRGNLRSRLRQAILKGSKKGSAVGDLGCSIDELKKHLQSKFTNEMSWNNYGSVWHIDHIIGLINFDLTSRDQLLIACHYTNLQPLTVEENLKKKKYI